MAVQRRHAVLPLPIRYPNLPPGLPSVSLLYRCSLNTVSLASPYHILLNDKLSSCNNFFRSSTSFNYNSYLFHNLRSVDCFVVMAANESRPRANPASVASKSGEGSIVLKPFHYSRVHRFSYPRHCRNLRGSKTATIARRQSEERRVDQMIQVTRNGRRNTQLVPCPYPHTNRRISHCRNV